MQRVAGRSGAAGTSTERETGPGARRAPGDASAADALLAETANAAFLHEHPRYADTGFLDELRATEFARLDRTGHVYLDYTGGGLYAQAQLREHMQPLKTGVFGNPHSVNPTSAASTELAERARAYVLDFFSASPEEYVAIFTPNATGAMRVVGEAYPFHHGDRFLLTFDNHNSVNGIREFARSRGAETTYVPSVAPDLRVDASLLRRYLTDTPGDRHNLFAYPAQSNFSGVQHSLGWIAQAQAHGWDVLLDAAAYVPTNRLDLSRWHPDFVAISFYKMFGWPTGVGCLLARRDALAKLERPRFSGGTIVAAFVQRQYYQSAPGAAHFEDGTLNYLNLPGVEIGLRFIDRIGLEMIHTRVGELGAWLLDALSSLRHTDGSPAATIYGPRSWQQRGATIAFNFLHPDGRVVDERYVDRIAGRHKISLRTGCFCNPGAGEVAFTISRETLVGGEFGQGMTLDDYVRAIGLPSGGAIRASLGLASNFPDMHRFMQFAREFVDLSDVPAELPPRIAC
jgi:molybdenum cofactor sulfurtransferase